MNESANTSEKLDMNYTANAMFVLVMLFLGYFAWAGLSNASSGDTFYARIGLIALILSILYVGLQIGRLAGKLQ
jgi:hypothetical protein